MDTVMWRMYDVENILEADLRKRRPWQPRSLAHRLHQFRSPRLGVLYQHGPAPLLLPASYWRTEPPNPAPSISIVTPSFGQGRFVERTLFSVIGQEYPQLEYVVQDGGSTDETVDVLSHHAATLSHWESARDGGQADALNRGFARTSGDIMAYLNSDDLLLPGSLAYVARYFVEHPDVDVVYGQRVLIDSSDRSVGIWVLPPHDDTVLTLVDYVPQETLFWRRRIWDAAGGSLDATLKFALDWDLLLRFREQGATFARLPRFLGAFRVHAAQKTQRDQEICEVECNSLRQHVHGRHVSNEEATAKIEPYLRRHVREHVRQRLLERLPIPRRDLQTVPADAWLLTPQAREKRIVARSNDLRPPHAANGGSPFADELNKEFFSTLEDYAPWTERLVNGTPADAAEPTDSELIAGLAVAIIALHKNLLQVAERTDSASH
jgi:glycosyltransferase involved in cell wall biosynthesis